MVCHISENWNRTTSSLIKISDARPQGTLLICVKNHQVSVSPCYQVASFEMRCMRKRPLTLLRSPWPPCFTLISPLSNTMLLQYNTVILPNAAALSASDRKAALLMPCEYHAGHPCSALELPADAQRLQCVLRKRIRRTGCHQTCHHTDDGKSLLQQLAWVATRNRRHPAIGFQFAQLI